MVKTTQQDDRHIISLFPNRSATWRETRRLILFIAFTCLLVGVAWTIRGVWMILPFSLLEAALVAWLMYRVSRHTYQRQVISFGRDDVTIEQGLRFPQRRWVLDRARTHLSVTVPEHHLDAIRIQVFDPQHSVEIGGFLNAEDRRLALSSLREAGLNIHGHARLESSTF